jgi:hypothetical protein
MHGDRIMGCGCQKVLEAATVVTPCECAVAGWCERHKMHKVPHYHKLCRTHLGYFAQYEAGRGPGQLAGTGTQQTPLRTFGLGDAVAWIIRVATFGRVKPCMACKSRMARLNRLLTLWPIGRKK